MSKLVSIKKWKKDHVVKREDKRTFYFYCGRESLIDQCEEILDAKNCCASCFTLSNLGPICSNGEDEQIGVKSIVRCPREISETGLIKIVGDQTNCKPNVLQPGSSNWDYLVVMYDPDYPNESHSYFEVTKLELDKWRSVYK